MVGHPADPAGCHLGNTHGEYRAILAHASGNSGFSDWKGNSEQPIAIRRIDPGSMVAGMDCSCASTGGSDHRGLPAIRPSEDAEIAVDSDKRRNGRADPLGSAETAGVFTSAVPGVILR